MKKEQHTHEAPAGQQERPTGERSRRDFLRKGSMGLGGLAGAAAMGIQASQVKAQESSSGKNT